MPRIALVCACLLVGVVGGGCSFSADYTGAIVYCSDGKCPSGLECRTDLATTPECRAPRQDAATDVPDDSGDAGDAGMVTLTCVQPGILTSGVSASDSTTNRMNLMWSSCGGGVQNGHDAVYKITTTAPNKQLVVNITGSLSAYVLNSCMQMGNTPACLGGNPAVMGNPISVTAAAAGSYWVVVDNLNAGVSGAYTVTVTVQ